MKYYDTFSVNPAQVFLWLEWWRIVEQSIILRVRLLCLLNTFRRCNTTTKKKKTKYSARRRRTLYSNSESERVLERNQLIKPMTRHNLATCVPSLVIRYTHKAARRRPLAMWPLFYASIDQHQGHSPRGAQRVNERASELKFALWKVTSTNGTIVMASDASEWSGHGIAQGQCVCV